MKETRFTTHLNELRREIEGTLERYAASPLLGDEEASLTGSEIKLRTDELSKEIQKYTQPGDAVGISLPNSVPLALSLLATIRSGRIPVIYKTKEDWEKVLKRPMSLFIHSQTKWADSSLPQIKISHCAQSLDWELKTLTSDTLVSTRQWIAPGTGFILYTSGSSGDSKGVMMPAQGTLFLSSYLKDHFDLSSETVSSIVLPLAHTMCINTHFFPTFFAGGLCRFVPISMGMGQIYRDILSTRGTCVAVVSELLNLMWEEKEKRELPVSESVKVLQISGGMISSTELQIAKKLFPNATLYKGYGLTEATRVAMVSSQAEDFAFAESGYRPLPGVEIEIRHEDRLCQPGERGEIHIKSPTLMKGYFASNSNRFDQRGFLKTGDQGEMKADGRFVIYGRNDGVFKVNGELVSSFQIESLAKKMSCDRFSNASCIPIQHRNRKRLYLFVESQQKDPSREELRKLRLDLRQELRVGLRIIPLRKLPHLSNGKIDRQTLISLAR